MSRLYQVKGGTFFETRCKYPVYARRTCTVDARI